MGSAGPGHCCDLVIAESDSQVEGAVALDQKCADPLRCILLYWAAGLLVGVYTHLDQSCNVEVYLLFDKYTDDAQRRPAQRIGVSVTAGFLAGREQSD
ncbi:MAG: hypothetical protein Ct9H300mP16_01290 [Pseudomonadota bacterium]|nr:MAG: hypothetical protein Ct9H300mP16_01290 [Pseudomonadota bacterium]